MKYLRIIWQLLPERLRLLLLWLLLVAWSLACYCYGIHVGGKPY